MNQHIQTADPCAPGSMYHPQCPMLPCTRYPGAEILGMAVNVSQYEVNYRISNADLTLYFDLSPFVSLWQDLHTEQCNKYGFRQTIPAHTRKLMQSNFWRTITFCFFCVSGEPLYDIFTGDKQCVPENQPGGSGTLNRPGQGANAKDKEPNNAKRRGSAVNKIRLFVADFES